MLAGSSTDHRVLPVIDITPWVKTAREAAGNWDWTQLVSRIRMLAASEGWAVDWDQGAGEAWARVLDGTSPVALVWTAIPFAFVHPRASELRRLLAGSGVEILELSDFDEPILRLDPDALNEVIEFKRWPEVITPSRLSASDLWWATV